MKMANMDDYFDVVIVGTGAAGLYCALNLPAQHRAAGLCPVRASFGVVGADFCRL